MRGRIGLVRLQVVVGGINLATAQIRRILPSSTNGRGRKKQGGLKDRLPLRQARRVGNRVRLASGIPARVSHSARGRCATKITDAVVWRLGTRHDHVPLNEPCSSTVETRPHRD